MFQGKVIGATLLMAGEGRRFGNDVPKQFHLLDGKPIYRHALDALLSVALFDEIVLVCHPDWIHLISENLRVIAGGKTRQESSYRGLKAFQKRPDITLIHDAVRPFVTERILKENVLDAIRWGAANTCIPSTDTLVHAPNGNTIIAVPKREEYWRGQTPQTFRTDWILEAHEKALADGIENASDDCQLLLKLGRAVRIVKGEEQNLKITSARDLSIAERLICKELYT